MEGASITPAGDAIAIAAALSLPVGHTLLAEPHGAAVRTPRTGSWVAKGHLCVFEMAGDPVFVYRRHKDGLVWIELPKEEELRA